MLSQPNKYFPPAALLLGTLIWGTVWYPYRLLAERGLAGTPATFLTYFVTLIAATLFFARSWSAFSRSPQWLLVLACGSGWANYAYVMGTLEGEVMRTLLLFYLAPVWTVPLARWLLNERPNAASYGVIALALTGAVTMLWQPGIGWQLVKSSADWFGLTAGFAFAVNNVVARRLNDQGVGVKTIASCLGVLAITGVAMLTAGNVNDVVKIRYAADAALVFGIGIALFFSSVAVFYAVARLPSVRAIVIMLFELVVGAVSAHWLAGESMSAREWIGGTLIVTATLFSAIADPKAH
jgi:drug/metabolite transporter (DMT)-like permease